MKIIKTKLDYYGRELPNWKNAIVYHSTDEDGLHSIQKHGFKLLPIEQGGYYGQAISFTKDIAYSRMFGEITIKAKLSNKANILNLNDEHDWDKWLTLTRNQSLSAYLSIAIRNGIDGVFDPGAGDLFIYNPKVVKYISFQDNRK